MTLTSGLRLGPYEILAPLGAGGMGEVYRARDTRLDRTVAIKVLPQHLSSSSEVRHRFEREAKTISQLSHPHICAFFDVGEATSRRRAKSERRRAGSRPPDPLPNTSLSAVRRRLGIWLVVNWEADLRR